MLQPANTASSRAPKSIPFVLALGCWLLVSSILWAQNTKPDVKSKPAKASDKSADLATKNPKPDSLKVEDDPFRLRLPDNFFLKILDNKLQVLVIEDPEVPLVTFTIGLRGGVFSQSNGYLGVPYLLDRLLPKPTLEDDNKEEFQKKWKAIAPIYRSRLTADYLGLQLQLQTKQAPEALQMLGQMLRYPKFDTADIVDAKKHYTDALFASEANPVVALQQELHKAYWGASAYLFDDRGSYATVRNVSRLQLMRYQTQVMAPCNTLLIIAGDIKHEEWFVRVDSALGSWPNPFPLPLEDVPPIMERKDTAFSVISELTVAPTVIVSFPLPSVQANAKSYYTALVLARLLSQQNNEFARALQTQALPYDLSCTYYPSIRESRFQLTLTGSAQDLRRALIQLLAQIDTLANPFFFSENAIDQAKQTLEADYIYAQYPVSDLSYNLLNLWAFHDLLRYKHYVNGIQAVNRFDITFFIRDFFQFKPAITAVLATSEHAQIAGLDSLLAALPAKRLEAKQKPKMHPTDNQPVEKPEPKPQNPIDADLITQNNGGSTPAVGGGGYLALLQGARPPDARDSIFAKYLGPDGTNPMIPVSLEELKAYRILFKINKVEFDSTDKVVLGRVVDFVNQHPNQKVFINGHTDLSGPADYNLYLSFQRALIVKDYIKGNYKCDFERLVVRGLGEQKPEFDETSPEKADLNRRVDFSTE